jgi:N-acetylneuraminic acid mutarotase
MKMHNQMNSLLKTKNMKTITFLIAILFAVCLNNNYAQNTWKRKANFGGTARFLAVGFSIGSKGYIGTGYNNNNLKYYNDFWEYDPATNSWTQKADFGGKARRQAVGFSIGSKGYIGTGDSNFNSFNDFWEYDPATNAWTRKADFGGVARRNAVGFSIGSKGYIGTGYNNHTGRDATYYKDFWEYDPASNVWTQKANFGGGLRAFAVGFSIGIKGYVGTGYNNSDRKDFWEYDPGMDTWTKKADFGGEARDYAVGFSIGSKGYIGTGINIGTKYKDFWEYDPVTNAWKKKADFGGTARWTATGFSIGSKGYIGTGVGTFLYNDFWEYTPESTCLSPSGLKVQEVTDTSAVLKWHLSGANILQVWLRYRPVGDTIWLLRKKDAPISGLIKNGLMPNTTYQWQLRSLCTEDTSGWVIGPDFTTAASSFAFSSATSAITGSKLPGNIHVQIMPNPNKGNFAIQLQLPAKAAITALALYNNMGGKVWQQDAGKISGTVYKDISLRDQLPAGTYMMVVQRDDVRLMQKIVINK